MGKTDGSITCQSCGAYVLGVRYSASPQPSAEAVPDSVAVELTKCCGREECGGECGNEWRGMEWVRKQPAPVPAGAVSDAPTPEAAEAMGRTGSPAIEAERIAFESWMRGHCWAVSAIWDGQSYVGSSENAATGAICQYAMRTRQLWAAWRDRAALASHPAQAVSVPGYAVTRIRSKVGSPYHDYFKVEREGAEPDYVDRTHSTIYDLMAYLAAPSPPQQEKE